MGNSESKSQQHEQQFWSQWSTQERELIKKALADTTFNDLPTWFSPKLHTCITNYLGSKNEPSYYLSQLHKLIKQRDPHQVYKIYQSIGVNLETFVTWVVNSAIPLWFESGSTYTYEQTDTKSPIYLAQYILNISKEKEQQKQASLSWLDDNNANQPPADNDWAAKTTDFSSLTESEFTEWYNSTYSFQGLFQLVVQYTVFHTVQNIQDLHESKLNKLACPQLQTHDKETQRMLGSKYRFSNLIDPFGYYLLTLHMPASVLSWSDHEQAQRNSSKLQHSLIFSSKRDGTSWQVFVNKMTYQGATLIVIKAKDGSVFGGYADTTWENSKTTWYGSSSNFLFRLANKFGAWDGSNSSNANFQYLCWGKKSLPNGFGMGGQFDYAGLWIDSDFIHGYSRAGPTNTTYGSPILANKEIFIVDEVEVWLVGPLEKNEDDEQGSGGKGVLGHAEDMEFMEMAGKKMYSKDLSPDPSKDDKNQT